MSIYGQDTGSNLNFQFSGGGKNSAFNSGGSSGGGGGGGSFPNPSGNTKRFSTRGYTATVKDKLWTVSFRGTPAASDVNSNTLAVNEQLARDWILSDIKRRELIEAGDNEPLDPGLANPDYTLPGLNNPEIEVNPETQEESTPMTDNERFLLIGVVVLAGLYGFIKK